jgi:uncharacterized protein YndB with AHSA1/START domain
MDVLEQVAGTSVIRIERSFSHPVERVWAALTEPQRLVDWWCGMVEVLEVELVNGGRFVVRWLPELADDIDARSPDEPLVTEDTVLQVDPPRLFEHTLDGSPESIVRWELRPDGDGCRLFLTHTVAPAKAAEAQSFLEGWGMCLGFMERALDGDPVGLPGLPLQEMIDRFGGEAS